MDYLQSVTSPISAILLIAQLSVNIYNTDWFHLYMIWMGGIKVTKEEKERNHTRIYIFHIQNCVESFLLSIAQMRVEHAKEEKVAEIVLGSTDADFRLCTRPGQLRAPGLA